MPPRQPDLLVVGTGRSCDEENWIEAKVSYMPVTYVDLSGALPLIKCSHLLIATLHQDRILKLLKSFGLIPNYFVTGPSLTLPKPSQKPSLSVV